MGFQSNAVQGFAYVIFSFSEFLGQLLVSTVLVLLVSRIFFGLGRKLEAEMNVKDAPDSN